MQPTSDATTAVFAAPIGIAHRVLIVDDDELVLATHQHTLEQAGFEVFIARNAEEALDSMRRKFAQIVVLDRNMPGMGGLEFCRTIRNQSYPGYVYLILLTVQDGESDVLTGLDAGADDYLSKRTSAAQLVARLRTAQRIVTLEHSLKRLVEERSQMAMTDALTGAHNRRYFMRNAARELKRLQRSGGTLSLLLLDLDHFKQINDRYGHSIGDMVLIESVRRLRGNLPRAEDWCARIGGEEFAVLLPQTGTEGACVVAERLRRCIAEVAMATTSGPVAATLSVGVAVVSVGPNDEAVGIDALLESADTCLYRSKDEGRNRVTVGQYVAVQEHNRGARQA